MTTQIENARKGLVTPQMEAVSIAEDVSAEYIRTMVAEGKIVIPWNTVRKPQAVGVGKGLRTKVNASIGTSSDIIDYAAEIRKAKAAVAAGADTLMELSVGGDLDRVRREVIAASICRSAMFPCTRPSARRAGNTAIRTSSTRSCSST